MHAIEYIWYGLESFFYIYPMFYNFTKLFSGVGGGARDFIASVEKGTYFQGALTFEGALTFLTLWYLNTVNQFAWIFIYPTGLDITYRLDITIQHFLYNYSLGINR